ncbi:MAG: hypothetical protein JW915_11075 [Chitinispirillaceae bacterium]|nr:hypothetical protein [Chitinispirillaceae bacterium]
MNSIDKSVPGWTDEYKSTRIMDFDGEGFYIRLVTIDMDPNDTFYMQIPAEYETRSVARCISDFFLLNESGREKIKATLEVEDFPELPEIYDYFCDLFEDERCGRLILEYSINGGPSNINVADLAYDHLSLTEERSSREKYKVLHLILDTQNVPFRDIDDQAEVKRMKMSFLGLFLYYHVTKQNVSTIDPSTIDGEVKDAITYCEDNNLLKCKKVLIGDDMKLTVTDHGKKYFDELYDEAQYYVSNFEIFSHVFVDGDYIRFNHVEGKDYRIQVMRHEGIDVYRAVMVMSMMNGTFDDSKDEWEKEMRSINFFSRYFGACVNTDIEMSKQDFVAMIKQGKRTQAVNNDSMH